MRTFVDDYYRKTEKTDMKRILSSILLVLFAVCATAQKEYYASIEGKNGGKELKTALYNLIKNHKQISYGSGESSTWGAFYTTDAVIENDRRRVLDMYSGEKRYFGSKGSAISGMNIEHSVAKSWWGGNKNNAYHDLHHLNPSDQNANSRKSNYPLGELTSVSWDNGVAFVGNANIDGSSQNAFEPCDEYKGDFARTYMYMFTCYQDLTWEKTWMNYANSEYPTLKPWAVKLLLKWHKQDPVSEKEVNRNNAVHAVQGNRNPYVDYPQLADYVWGDSINFVFHLNGDVESGSGSGYGDGNDGDDNDGDDSGNTGGGNDGDNDGNDDGNDDGNSNFTEGEFTLVTNAAQLTVGDYLIIAYNNFAMGKSAGNYRYKTDITVKDNRITQVADDVQIIVLENGVKNGTYAFNVDGSYLAASSSSDNYLATVSTLDANGSWTITINNNAATIKAQGNKTRNILQYNKSAPRFSCYTGTQQPVNIYAKAPVAAGVEEVVTDDAVVNAIFDLAGRRLNEITEPGIYIINGKKVLVK